MNDSQISAFWSKVDIKGNKKECWEWKGARKPKGYGNVCVDKKTLMAHRVSFELANNMVIPNGLMVCHSCDNPPCCNPSHLMLGTTSSNAIDMLIKGRQKKPESAARGSTNGNSKLTENDVLNIREKYENKELNQYQLADIYNVTQPTIGFIVRKETWRHVK